MGRTVIWRIAALIALLGFASACSTPNAGHAASQQLRIENAGGSDIKNLAVLFPGATANAAARRVEFGDLAAGKISDYRSVPAGVYRYAAYEYTLDGVTIDQAVVDWLGESPMQGTKFTYRILLDASKLPGDQIRLIEVRTDDPSSLRLPEPDKANHQTSTGSARGS